MNHDIHKIEPDGFPLVSPVMLDVLNEIRAFAYHGRSCLISGPPGCGKEFVARYYHKVFRIVDPNASFITFNCRVGSSELAWLKLFGSTDADFNEWDITTSRVLSSALGGILFLDEIYELPDDILSLVIRMVDHQNKKAEKAIIENKSAMIDKIILLGATASDLDQINLLVTHKFGNVVKVSGVAKRTEDIRGAVKHFAKQSIRRLRDRMELIQRLFQIDNDQALESLNGQRPTEFLAERISNMLTIEIEKREWPGNFRELKNAIDKAIIRVEDVETPIDFARSVYYYYHMYFGTGEPSMIVPSKIDTIRQKIENTDLDERLWHTVVSIFSDEPEEEKRLWTLLLQVLEQKPFLRRDIEDLFPNIGSRTLQNRLTKLINAGILRRSGNLGEIYQRSLLSSFRISRQNPRDFLSIPNIDHCDKNWKDYAEEVAALLTKTQSIHISAGKMKHVSEMMKCIADNLAHMATVFYYSADSQGILPLITRFEEELRACNILPKTGFPLQESENIELKVAALSGYVAVYLKDVHKPVLVIENIDALRTSQEVDILNIILEFWADFAFVLSGEKLGNAISQGKELGLVELHLE